MTLTVVTVIFGVFAIGLIVLLIYKSLSGHPKPANEGHLKTGQRE